LQKSESQNIIGENNMHRLIKKGWLDFIFLSFILSMFISFIVISSIIILDFVLSMNGRFQRLIVFAFIASMIFSAGYIPINKWLRRKFHRKNSLSGTKPQTSSKYILVLSFWIFSISIISIGLVVASQLLFGFERDWWPVFTALILGLASGYHNLAFEQLDHDQVN
jgi:hypothetical protein